MGFDKKVGLGRNAKAPTKLIEESKQKGLRGLGYTFTNFNDQSADWDFDTDPVRTASVLVVCSLILVDRLH